jgi:hypothetical protein
MTLANMRANGVHVVSAACEACGHKADVNVDALPETVTVPKAGERLRCSQCGGKRGLDQARMAQRPTSGRSGSRAIGDRHSPPVGSDTRLGFRPRTRGGQEINEQPTSRFHGSSGASPALGWRRVATLGDNPYLAPRAFSSS